MALVETFYAAVFAGESLPSQDEWLDSRDDAEDSARSMGEYDTTEITGYEITVRAIFRGVHSVVIENI